jgi:antitoxin MazE
MPEETNMKTVLRSLGNSKGIIIPKPILVQMGFEDEVDMAVEGDALVIRRPRIPRAGWAEAAKQIAAAGDDALVVPEFGNEGDAELAW